MPRPNEATNVLLDRADPAIRTRIFVGKVFKRSRLIYLDKEGRTIALDGCDPLQIHQEGTWPRRGDFQWTEGSWGASDISFSIMTRVYGRVDPKQRTIEQRRRRRRRTCSVARQQQPPTIMSVQLQIYQIYYHNILYETRHF